MSLLTLRLCGRLRRLCLLKLSEHFGRIDTDQRVTGMYLLSFFDEELRDASWDFPCDADLIYLYLAGDDVFLLSEEDKAGEGKEHHRQDDNADTEDDTFLS